MATTPLSATYENGAIRIERDVPAHKSNNVGLAASLFQFDKAARLPPNLT